MGTKLHQILGKRRTFIVAAQIYFKFHSLHSFLHVMISEMVNDVCKLRDCEQNGYIVTAFAAYRSGWTRNAEILSLW